MHRIYWYRDGAEARFLAECPAGCRDHPPGMMRCVGTLGPGRAGHYLGVKSPPWWLCGYGIPSGALMHALALVAREPNAGGGWILPGGCEAPDRAEEMGGAYDPAGAGRGRRP